MTGYALLLRPAANRVYAAAAAGLAQAELELFSRAALGGSVSEIRLASIGGVRYVTFEAPAVDDRAAAFLANLSAGYALFERAGEDLLRPVRLSRLDRYDDDLVTILKYQGKTNEQFTKLLLNATVLSSAFAAELISAKLTVLDPLCGRGTTLSQALMYGYDAAGIDIDRQDFDAYATFIKTWLQRKRVKHHVSYDGPVRREGKVIARRLQLTMAGSREAWKAGATQLLDVVSAPAERAGEFFRPGTVHVVVTDAPYGVQHASRTGPGKLARSPLDLLAAAVPAWTPLLRPGGAIGISWNTLVARREDAARVLADAGLEPLADEPYLRFRHRVDQAIVRDILIARKPG